MWSAAVIRSDAEPRRSCQRGSESCKIMPHYSQEVAEEIAFTPLGTSTAAAIVACCLFFVFSCLAVGNWIWTKYSFYDVLIISTACESLSFSHRAIVPPLLLCTFP